jgi:hypothetical protein
MEAAAEAFPPRELPELEDIGASPSLSPELWWERPLTWMATAIDASVVAAMRTVVDRLLLTMPAEDRLGLDDRDRSTPRAAVARR